MRSKKKIIWSLITAGIILIVTAIFVFLGTYAHSEPIVDQYLVSSETVQVSEIDNYYMFDGSGNEKAIVFYPGAKVEAKSYAPLLYKLAENGVDCFLV